MKKNVLILKDVSYEVSNNNENKVILKNINLQFDNNNIYVITGQNGSGKSTLAKLIMGIIKPTSGKIIFNGKDITSLGISERANLGISLAFQQPITFKGLTVKNLLDAACNKNTKLKNACDNLSVVGLCAKNYINREFDNSLSGGEQKRIELALTLSRESSVNVFDEPEAGIDLWSFDSLVNIFKSLNSTTIIISHQKKILEIANKVVVLKNGEIASFDYLKNISSLEEEKTCSKLGEANG